MDLRPSGSAGSSAGSRRASPGTAIHLREPDRGFSRVRPDVTFFQHPGSNSRMTTARLLFLGMNAALATTGAAQSPAPSANARAQAREVIAVINRGDSAAAAHFLSARVARPEPGLVRLLLDLRRQSGGVDERGTETLGRGVAVKLWARNADRGVTLYVAPDPADSTRIGRLAALRFFHPAAEVRALPPASGGVPKFLSGVQTELKRLAAAGELSGTVAIGRGDSLLY